MAGFPVAKKYSEADLLKIGEKYGDVAGCCLVRNNRKVKCSNHIISTLNKKQKLYAKCQTLI